MNPDTWSSPATLLGTLPFCLSIFKLFIFIRVFWSSFFRPDRSVSSCFGVQRGLSIVGCDEYCIEAGLRDRSRIDSPVY